MARVHAFAPEWVSPPGETISDLLTERGWTQSDLAERTGFTRKHVNEVVQGKASVTSDTALRFEAVLGSTAGFWLRREANYREALERSRTRDEDRTAAGWLRELPIPYLVKQGVIRRFRHRGDQVRECLRCFGVASVPAWRATYEGPLADFRASPKVPKRAGAIAAWIRCAEIKAAKIECAPFDRKRFRAALSKVRHLTLQANPMEFVPRMRALFAASGVACVVVAPPPPGCPVSGAARWLSPDKAMIALSFRHRADDHLWFTVFHEAAHVLLHGKRLWHIDTDSTASSQSEDEANRFARELLMPGIGADELREASGSPTAIRRLASKLGIAPGIIVGRMQREEVLGWNHMNTLKIRYDAAVVSALA